MERDNVVKQFKETGQAISLTVETRKPYLLSPRSSSVFTGSAIQSVMMEFNMKPTTEDMTMGL